MKVGILTFHHASNYGAVLQAYATSQTLRRLGHEPIILDYRPAGLYDHYFKFSWKRLGLVGQNLVNFKVNPKFRRFREEHLPVGAQRCATLVELNGLVDQLDAVLYGSDQIWNPKLFGGRLDAAFWAEGVSASVKKIAVAASFGGTQGLRGEYRQQIRQLIQNFDSISVRELYAQELLSEVAGVKAELVMDPVFSGDYWDDLLEPVPEYEGCIFQFVLQQNQRVYDAAGNLKSRLNVRVVSGNSGIQRRGANAEVFTPSVGQWLWLIKNASHVVTNSFHATAFSLIFGKPFTVIQLQGNMETRNQRILNLLEQVGLSARMVDALGVDSVNANWLAVPDYSQFKVKLESNQTSFLDFIKNALA